MRSAFYFFFVSDTNAYPPLKKNDCKKHFSNPPETAQRPLLVLSGRADNSFKGEVVEAVLGGGGQAGRQPPSQRERERESEAGGGGAGILNLLAEVEG